ncbi:MAG: glycosyltransferase involved in cell wall biosynthesis [Paracoccaceae bacterium]|jgi:glycosyltransferase involved in cell wall biosynthesis
MKIAVIHDWLVTYAGAERALEQIINVFPECDLFSLVDHVPKSERLFLSNHKVKTSFIQNLPFSRTSYRKYLSLMPLAIEQFDLSEYDLIISSSHAVAKGVITGPDQLHICYCYTPIRYAWDLQHQYLREAGLDKGVLGWVAKNMLHKIRIWDSRTSNGVDHFIAISNFISKRIYKVYRRESSAILHCPVDIEKFEFCDFPREEFYVTCSRMVPYKRIDLIVEAFTKLLPDRKLIVIGDGPEFKKVKALSGSNVSLLGSQSSDVLKEHLSKAKAFLFAAEEDFGIAPIEAQACGTPVIAYGKGGALETIKGLKSANPTGIFFQDQTIESLAKAVCDFDLLSDRISPRACRVNAENFSSENFRVEFSSIVESFWEEFNRS